MYKINYNILASEVKYSTIKKKVNEQYLENKKLIEDINESIIMYDKMILGIKISLGLEREDTDPALFIPFNSEHRHNSLSKLKTIEKRKQVCVNDLKIVTKFNKELTKIKHIINN